MQITCPVHRETEAYDDRTCRACACERSRKHQAKQRHIREQERLYVPLVHGDAWLTCNQPECGKLCVDAHDLYEHKTTMHQHSAGDTHGPELRSLIQSTLRER